MKKIIFCLTILIIVFFIGVKVNYRSNINFYMGDDYKSEYVYRYKDTRVEDIIRDIDDNIVINGKHIQNLLIRANNIYINLNDLYLNKYSIGYINELLYKLRTYSKENIIIILRNGNTIIEKKINSWIFQLKDKYDIIVER